MLAASGNASWRRGTRRASWETVSLYTEDTGLRGILSALDLSIGGRRRYPHVSTPRYILTQDAYQYRVSIVYS